MGGSKFDKKLIEEIVYNLAASSLQPQFWIQGCNLFFFW